MKTQKENERKYPSGKLNKCDAQYLDPVMFQTLRILSLGKALHCLSLFLFTLTHEEGDFGVQTMS